jgi:large subunit ribosomal protein L9
MEVILLERIARLGTIGDLVNVRNGYARNFLIPFKKALRASEANKKVFEARRSEIEAANASAKAEAEIIAKKLDGFTLTLARQASQEGKLYGSIAVRDIAEELKAAGHTVERSQIIMAAALKNIGNFPIKINLHADVVATVNVDIKRLEAEAA